MSRLDRYSHTVVLSVVILGFSAGAARAQTAPPPSTTTIEDTRPATTTFYGDTGLWYVPSGEVLPAGRWSTSFYRRGTNYIQGYTNVGDFAATFAYGIKDRAEIFGSFLLVTRIDRDTRPLFFADPTLGGIVERYPGATKPWSGNNLGDFYIGAKYNLLSEVNERPLAVSLRGMLKLPTGKDSAGVSTGKLDTLIDFVASREISRVVELSGYAGMEFRGNPDGFDLPRRAFRWGVGAGFPTRWQLRGFAELNGVLPSSGSSVITSAVVTGQDGTQPPASSDTEKLTRLTFGLTYQAANGFFVGGGLSRNMPTQHRDLARASEGSFTDYTDWQFRIGFHPGINKRVSPSPAPTPPPLALPRPEPVAPAAAPPVAPPAAPPAQALAAAPDHILTVKAACDPCIVEVGKTSIVTATAVSSIGCSVSYRWNAPFGTFADPTLRSTIWTAPNNAGVVPVTVTVTCPIDAKTASDTVDIRVTAAQAKTYTFEDVYFDYDRSSNLRADAIVILDSAIDAMKKDATLNLSIEGYTCNVGTDEYNKALANRRAIFVRDYVMSKGIAADRLKTVAHGEEYPKFSNDTEEMRRLNRRVALVVVLEQRR